MITHPDRDAFAAGLVRELAEHQAREAACRVQNQTTCEPQISRDALRKLALLRSEVLQVSAIISLVASIANRLCGAPNRHISVQALTAFKPVFSTMSESLVAGLIQDAAFFSLAQRWQLLTSRLAFALLLNGELVRTVDPHGAARDCDQCEAAADAWRRVCKATLKLHDEVAQLMATADLVCDPSVERPTLGLLRASADGASPCLDADCRISVPGWAERRADKRRALDIRVRLSVGSVTSEATLIDVSRSGLGLVFSTIVPIGTRAIVWLPDSRKLDGVVSWSKGGRLGVKLARQLPKDDPMLVDAAQ